MTEDERHLTGAPSGLSTAFEKIAQISYHARRFIEQKFKSSENLQRVLAEEGANVEVDPFGGIDVGSMSPEEIGRFARAYSRVHAKARGEDPDEAEAHGIDWLLANHFNVDIELAHKLALGHIRGEVRDEKEAREFIARHQDQS